MAALKRHLGVTGSMAIGVAAMLGAGGVFCLVTGVVAGR